MLINPTPAIIPNHSCMVTMALPYEPKDKTKAVAIDKEEVFTNLVKWSSIYDKDFYWKIENPVVRKVNNKGTIE